MTTGQTRKGWGGWNWSRTSYLEQLKEPVCGGVYFEFNERKPSSSTGNPIKPEQNTIELETVCSTEERQVAEFSSIFSIVELKDYDVAEKTIHYTQINHVIDKPKTKFQKQKKT